MLGWQKTIDLLAIMLFQVNAQPDGYQVVFLIGMIDDGNETTGHRKWLHCNSILGWKREI